MKRPTCLQALEPRPMCSLLLSGHATQGGSLHVTCDKDQTRITPEVNKLATPYDHQNDHNHIIFSIAQKVNPGKRERVGFTYFVPWVSDMMISSLSVLCKKERATREEERKRIKPSTTLLWQTERGWRWPTPSYGGLITPGIGRRGRDIGSPNQHRQNWLNYRPDFYPES